MARGGSYRGGSTLIGAGSSWFGGLKGKAKIRRHKALNKKLKTEGRHRLRKSPIAGSVRKEEAGQRVEASKVATLSDEQLENLIVNHRRHNATDRPLYLEALEERAKRKGRGLEFKTSLAIIRRAAAERHFVSYKEIADASRVEWNRVRFALGKHLWDLVEFSHRKGWPMLSAIVVNKANVTSGEMEAQTLAGFVQAARDLGYSVSDERAFLREQQAKVFEWAGGVEGSESVE